MDAVKIPLIGVLLHYYGMKTNYAMHSICIFNTDFEATPFILVVTYWTLHICKKGLDGIVNLIRPIPNSILATLYGMRLN